MPRAGFSLDLQVISLLGAALRAGCDPAAAAAAQGRAPGRNSRGEMNSQVLPGGFVPPRAEQTGTIPQLAARGARFAGL